jgi:hypothetical protein
VAGNDRSRIVDTDGRQIFANSHERDRDEKQQTGRQQ